MQALKQKLTPVQLNFCLAHMIRLPELFEYAQQHLKPTDFSAVTEVPYAILWDCALTVAERTSNKKLPEQLETVMQMEVTDRIVSVAGNRQLLSVQDETALISLFTFVFNIAQDKLDPTYYRSLVQDLIIERTVVGRLRRDLTTFNNQGHPVDMLGNLQEYHRQLQNVLTDTTKAGSSAFPTAYKPKKLGKFSTNIAWFDKFMNGGQAPGEVYVLLGPTGLGKTTTGINVAVEAARVWAPLSDNGTIPRKKISCFFSWEQDKERLMHRFWSYAAKIDSTRIEQYVDELITLSRRGALEPYEMELFADKVKHLGKDNVDGEFERLQMAATELGECVRIFDFSGDPDNPHAGEGGIDEVAGALKNVQQSGYDIGVVVLDYANAAVRKYLSGRGEDMSKMRTYLANFCNECRYKIALPFNCPVWALNQLNTESNRRSPTAEQHHSFTSECGNFAENAWFAFVFGTKDKVNNTCQLFCTKERRSKGDQPPAILKIMGNICTMQDVSNTYVVAPEIKQIAKKDMVRRRVDPAELRKRMEEALPGSSNLTDY